ncbi:hypothetical protein OUZ56_005671 [Daphnia magna]|uniref:Uncharacterized protein n=1 Tax=Daphnia magna TaxID=35525 RepID=A0ABQ9YTF5_9CRUS|nr:hypothetical protein OUZ56_005671 [Daphnia magna]
MSLKIIQASRPDQILDSVSYESQENFLDMDCKLHEGGLYEKGDICDPASTGKIFYRLLGSQCSYRLCCGSVLPLTMANSVTLGELFFIACLVEVYNFFSTLKSFLTSPWACKNALKMSHECTHAIPAMLDLRSLRITVGFPVLINTRPIFYQLSPEMQLAGWSTTNGSRQLQVLHHQKTHFGQQIRQRHHSSSKKIKISALYGIVLDAEPATNGTREELLKAEMQNFLAIPRLSADEMS